MTLWYYCLTYVTAKICQVLSEVGTMAAYIPKLRRLESGAVFGMTLSLITCALKGSMKKVYFGSNPTHPTFSSN